MTVKLTMISNKLLLLCITLVSGSPLDLASEPDTNENSDEIPIYRLSKVVTPNHYTLKIDPDFETSTFKGTVDITVFVSEATNEIRLHSKDLTIVKCTLKKKDTADSECRYSSGGNDLLIITNPTQLTEKTEYTLSIEYSGKLRKDMTGFYISSYTENGVKKFLAVTYFEPNHARKAFPCFDEPKFKTTFKISISRKTTQTTASNMPLESTIDDEKNPNRKLDVFGKSQPMPSYLVAFMVSEMDKTASKEKVNVIARKDVLKHTSYTLAQSERILKTLEEYTNMPYSLPKLDIAAIPDFKIGAMENWGLNTFRERYVIMDASNAATAHKRLITQLICHEFSHQWFGNLITPTEWDYLWIKEGLATYFEYHCAALVEPQWNLKELFVLEITLPALSEEMSYNQAMTTSITKPSQLENIYNPINYDKAGSIFRMLESVMSSNPKSFQTFLQNLLIEGRNKHGGLVNPNNIYEILETQVKTDSIVIPSKTSITQFMKSWTENIGFPLITVYRDPTSKKFRINQKPYSSLQSTKPTSDQEWIVPITCVRKSAPEFNKDTPTVWLVNKNEEELPTGEVDSSEWIICNSQYGGNYHRTQYSDEIWELLMQEIGINPNAFHPMIMARMIDDAFALAKDGHIKYEIPLKLAHLLENNTNVDPWIVGVSHLTKLWSRYVDTGNNLQLYLFIRNIIYNKILDHIGFHVKENESVLTKTGRTRIFSLLCLLDLPTCIQPSIDEYQKNAADISKIHPDLKEIVYCATLRNVENPQAVWNELWSLFERTEISYEKNVILKALTCARNVDLIERSLTRLSTRVRKQDRKYFLNSLSYSQSSVAGALKYVHSTISTPSKLDEDSLSLLKSILTSIEPRLQTATHLALLKSIKNKLEDLNQPDYSDIQKSISASHESASKRIEDNNKDIAQLSYKIQYIKGTLPEDSTSPPPKAAGVAVVPTYLTTFLCSFVFYFKFFI